MTDIKNKCTERVSQDDSDKPKSFSIKTKYLFLSDREGHGH